MPAKDCLKGEIYCPFKFNRQCPVDKQNCIIYQIYHHLDEKMGAAVTRMNYAVRALKHV